MYKKELEKVYEWAKKAQEIFKKSGETDFTELRKKEKVQMVNALEDSGLKIESDGDSDGICKYACLNDGERYIYISFFSKAYDPDDFERYISDLQCEIDDNYYPGKMTFDDLVEHIGNMLKTETNIVNLTPHAVTFYAQDGKTVLNTIPSSGMARAAQSRSTIGDINGIPVCKTSYGEVEGLPAPQPNTIYIVSVLTAQAAKDRKDLYIVDDTVRDSSGQILGCKALAQI